MRPSALLHYLLLPLRVSPLLLILIFGVVVTIAEQGGVFGIPTFLILGSWFFKYGFAVLDHVAEGRPEAPVLSYEMVNPLEQRPFGTFLLLVLFYYVTSALQTLVGDVAIAVMRILLLAIIPAMVAVMSVTGRFVEALNPIAVFGTIARIPIAYIALLVILGALWFIPALILQNNAASLAALWRMESFLPGGLSTTGFKGTLFSMVDQMLFMYAWLAMFACIGGTIYERRKELEFEAAASPERKDARANAELERQRDKIMDQVFAEMRGGALANAGDTVRKLITQAPRPLDECRWLYARAAAVDQRLADYIAQLTLPRLLDARATGEALNLVRERLKVTSDFRPQTSGQVLQLVQLARDAGDRSTARQLLANFNHHYANDPMTDVAAKAQAELQR